MQGLGAYFLPLIGILYFLSLYIASRAMRVFKRIENRQQAHDVAVLGVAQFAVLNGALMTYPAFGKAEPLEERLRQAVIGDLLILLFLALVAVFLMKMKKLKRGVTFP